MTDHAVRVEVLCGTCAKGTVTVEVEARRDGRAKMNGWESTCRCLAVPQTTLLEIYNLARDAGVSLPGEPGHADWERGRVDRDIEVMRSSIEAKGFDPDEAHVLDFWYALFRSHPGHRVAVRTTVPSPDQVEGYRKLSDRRMVRRVATYDGHIPVYEVTEAGHRWMEETL